MISRSFARIRSRRIFLIKLEDSATRVAADEREAQKVEGFQLAETALLAVMRRKACGCFSNPASSSEESGANSTPRFW